MPVQPQGCLEAKDGLFKRKYGLWDLWRQCHMETSIRSQSTGSDVSTNIIWELAGDPSPRTASPHLSRRYLNEPCQHTSFVVKGTMMYSINVFCSGSLLLSIASALTIAPPQSLVNLVPRPSSIANLTADAQTKGQPNLTLDWSSKNSSNKHDIVCDAERFGRGLTYDSCATAIGSFKTSFTGWITLGPRESSGSYNFFLPWRWISNDGRCIIDIFADPGVDAMATAHQLIDAALLLVEECVTGGKGVGGIVYDIGWQGKLALAVRPYDSSQVMCQEKPPNHPFEDDCEHLVVTMSASTEEEDTFGHDGTAGVTAPVPFVHETYSPTGCALAVVMDPSLPASATDTDIWHALWGYAVAIQGMCVRFGFEGSITHVGQCEHGRLIVWMLEQHNEHPYTQGNATLGTTIPHANLNVPSRIQSVGTS